MSKPIIEVENLSKCYRIGSNKEPYLSLRDELVKFASRFRPRAKDQGQSETNFWALDDVSFSVQEGEAIGIIGRNGAGKSTLLKILSQITPPTKGHITMRGRVASLLEVGTGFHPELTGRENIFLNGAILGMSREEIIRKFDEIVAFAEVERFLDTPVKRYSSGMYVRLAFAVAAHLEPEILVVDEVLAVGDAEFQKKCLGKMGEVAKGGRTVLFVSHNMAAVESLCSSAIVFEQGRCGNIGPTVDNINKYLSNIKSIIAVPLKDRNDRTGKGIIRFTDIRVIQDKPLIDHDLFNTIVVNIKLVNGYDTDVKVRLALTIRTSSEIGLVSCDSALKGELYTLPKLAESSLTCEIISPPLNAGEYYLNIAIFNNGIEPEDWITSACGFNIEQKGFDDHINTNPFPILSKFKWKVLSEVRSEHV
ncbi:ABC transporter ATP-binding protein [Geotalea uraniireducens]|uniref:ABC transporter related protein n=1 Tax=Geotalea uraniireducens (strain Rf4) TaxID=351605 RepID=A5GEL5_GEOUR|nr:ABC transporter ATP-binding protein [Geotalea uraniireducens]ABQ25870.1 ABC transporter related protein [Geotalea uraniireducens Rf4]